MWIIDRLEYAYQTFNFQHHLIDRTLMLYILFFYVSRLFFPIIFGTTAKPQKKTFHFIFHPFRSKWTNFLFVSVWLIFTFGMVFDLRAYFVSNHFWMSILQKQKNLILFQRHFIHYRYTAILLIVFIHFEHCFFCCFVLNFFFFAFLFVVLMAEIFFFSTCYTISLCNVSFMSDNWP